MTRWFAGQYWLVVAGACFLGIYVCFVYDTQRESTAVRQMRKSGMPASVEELKAKYSPEPAGANGAFPYIQAYQIEKGLDPSMWLDLPIAGDCEYEYGDTLSETQRTTLHLYVTLNEDAIALILQAQERPFVRIPGDRYDVYNNYPGAARQLSRLLSCATLDAALSGDFERLGQMITAELRMPEMRSEGGILLDALTLPGLSRWGFESMENALYFALPPRDTIKYWMEVLDQDIFVNLATLQKAIENEAGYSFQSFTLEGPIFEGIEGYAWNVMPWKVMNEWTQYHYFAQNSYVETMTFIVSNARKDFYEAISLSDTDLMDNEWSRRVRNFGIWMIFSDYRSVYTLFVRTVAQATTARTALASLLYREDYGRMPESLEVLTPDYLAASPRDPFTPDGVLRYKLTDTQAIFYSVGPDQEDDGGTESEGSILKDGDVIFRVPLAKPAT